jgi:hypothetical protein
LNEAAEQAIGGDVAVFHFGQEFLPRGLRVPDRLGKVRRADHHTIKLLADPAGHSPGPARSDLARVDQVFPFLPSEVERGYSGWVPHETDYQELAALEAPHFDQASLRSDL